MVIAIAAAAIMLVAIAGCWLLRFERATSDPVSLTAVSAVHSDDAQLDHASSPTSHTPFKSAGIFRNRPPTQSRFLPPPESSPSPTSMPTVWSWRDSTQPRAPAADHSGRNLLTQFCIARR
jgi:hypothetical protein